MLYGYKAVMDNRIATVVCAGDTIEEFTRWCDVNEEVVDGCLFHECYVMNFMDAMVNDDYRGYKHAVYTFFHDDDAQRDAFLVRHSIKEVKSANGRDKQDDMLHVEKCEVETAAYEDREAKYKVRQEEIEAITKAFYEDIKTREAAGEVIPDDQKHIYLVNEFAARTLGEELGLEEYDPWDSRNAEDVEEDDKVKDKIEKAKKMGELSGESFGDLIRQRKEEAAARKRAAEANSASQDNSPADTTDTASQDAPTASAEVETDEEKEEGKLYIHKIEVDTNSDGTIRVTGVSATKIGAEVDEDEKRRVQEEAERIKAERKARAKKLTPDDFVKALRGDGRMDSTGGAVIVGEQPKVRRSKPKKRGGLATVPVSTEVTPEPSKE